jgi:O-succinylbenzoate synthase
MQIDALELFWIKMPMVGKFTTSFGTTQEREILLVKASAGDATGWGESGADGVPLYSYETARTGWGVIEDFIAPVVLDEEWPEEGIAAAYAKRFSHWRWHPMARCAVEEALWVLEAERRDVSLQSLYANGRTVSERIPVGISLGIQDDFEVLAEQIDRGLEQGYQRIKLKIEPGKDVSVVEPVRLRFGDIPLMVDANCGYRNEPDPVRQLKELDGYGLLMIEQPLAHDDIDGHVPLQAELETPICLDESIHSAHHAAHAIDVEACRLINIKASRIGGRGAAIAIHDLCAARDIPVWCGGMLESGVGRLHNIAMASLPNFRMPGDLSASKRYWRQDIIDPPVEIDAEGHVTVPSSVGLGHEVVQERIEAHVVRYEKFSL